MITAVVDIETDSLTPTIVHCIVAKCYKTGQIHEWTQEDCIKFKDWSKTIDTFIMHNGLSFDAPVLNRLIGCDIQPSQVQDTLLESQLFKPIREDGHSLEAWGRRLQMPKGKIETFDVYTDDMLEYCKQDVNITHRLYDILKQEGRDFSSESKQLEKNVRVLVDQQEKNGFAFDLKKGMILLAHLEKELYELENWSLKEFKPTEVILKTKTKYIPFNIGSRQQIADRLIELGWQPEQHTDKGNIIVSETVLKNIENENIKPLAEKFARYFLLQKRTAMIQSWIDSCDRKTKRVHGKVLTLRTITGRMAHNSPNMAQIPATSSPYGKECRELWTVSNPYTHKLVGTDASGLELRCLAHYLKDDDFTNEILNGDIHTANMNRAGLSDRDQAKTFIYAFLYGAGSEKIGKIVGSGKKEGEQLIETFLSNLPSLAILRNKVYKLSRRGYLPALDKRLLHIRSPHSALNTLLQGAGAIICKQWLVFIMLRTQQASLDVKLVASIHDEYQFEVANKDVQRFCSITKLAMKDTERNLKVRCPLDNSFKVGITWAETH